MGTYDYVILEFICSDKVNLDALKKLLLSMEQSGYKYDRSKGYISKKTGMYEDGKGISSDISDSSLDSFGFCFSYEDLWFFLQFHLESEEEMPALMVKIDLNAFQSRDAAISRIKNAEGIFSFIANQFNDYILFGCADHEHFTHEMDAFFIRNKSIEDWLKRLTRNLFWLAYVKDDFKGRLSFDIDKERFISKKRAGKGWIVQSKSGPDFMGAVVWQ